MKRYSTLIVILLAALFLSGCAKKYSTELTVDMAEFMYSPAEFTIPAGQEITLTLTNKGAVVHEFVIMNFGKAVSVPFSDDDEGNIYWEHEVQPGGSETVTFTAPSDIGDYEVICGTAGHIENNMRATLTVVNP